MTAVAARDLALAAPGRERRMTHWRGARLMLSLCAPICQSGLPTPLVNGSRRASVAEALQSRVRLELLLPEN